MILEILKIICEYVEEDIKIKRIEDNIDKLNLKKMCYINDCYYIIERNIERLNIYDYNIFLKNCKYPYIIEREKLLYKYFHIICENKNKKVIEYLEKNIIDNYEDIKYIEIFKLNMNRIESKTIIRFLEKNKLISWYNLGFNSEAGYLLKNNINMINNNMILQYNESDEAVNYYTSKDICELSLNILCENKNKKNIEYLDKNSKFLYRKQWKILSKNPSALDIFRKYIKYIDWTTVCQNTNPNINLFIFENLDKIHIEELWLTSYAVYLFDKYEDINWEYISNNKKFWEIYPKYKLLNELENIFN